MEVSVCHPRELGPTECARWAELQAETGGLDNPFCSASFAKSVGEVDEPARVAVISDGPSIVGFLPFRPGRLGSGRPLAAGIAGCHPLLYRPGSGLSWREVLAGCHMTMWSFDNLVAPACPTVATTTIPSHVIDLTDGYERYLAAAAVRSKRYFNWLRRKRQRIERELGEIRFTSGLDDPAGLDALIRWKSDQYRRSGRPDPFARPWVLALVHRLDDSRRPDCTGYLSVMRAGDHVLAVDFSLHSRSVYAGWFVSYNTEFAAYSPGAVRWLSVLEKAAALGLSTVDLGPGDQDYKLRMATGTTDLFRGHLARPRPSAVAHRLARYPHNRGVEFVLAHPRLREDVRKSLRLAGSVRLRLAGDGPSESLPPFERPPTFERPAAGPAGQ
jgi:CelD/BcsL family acetyltransferase involved in cellulose biosynthesis